MKKITILILTLLCCLGTWAYNFPDESLDYKVMYKWGLINKQAGTVNISIKSSGNQYHSQLIGASASWADKFFRVRDTLTTVMSKSGLQPSKYVKIAHEGNEDKRDVVEFTYNGNTVIGNCSRYAAKDGKVTKDETRVIEAEGETVDMLCAFYYLRNLSFEEWEPGHKESVNIFSGKRKELLTFEYHGIKSVEYDKRTYQCYHVTFIFTSDGKKKSSDDMYAWLDITTRIPIKMEGKLPLGSVKCFYIGN